MGPDTGNHNEEDPMNKLWLMSFGVAVMTATAAAQCSIGNHGIIDAPGPAPANDLFGSSMAADGDRLVVGARGEGAVYVFEGQGASVTEVARLTPSVKVNQFGLSVDIDGDRMVVGTVSDVVLVFDKQGSTWVENGTLTPSVPGGGFGRTVAVSGDRIVVGTGGGAANGQAVYSFQRFTGLWLETQRIVTANTDVDLEDDDLIVGASIGTGSFVNAYTSSGSTWSLVNHFPEPGSGLSVSLEGDRFVVSRETAGPKVFHRVQGVWTLETTLDFASDTGVYLRGNRILSADDTGTQSRLYLFELIDGAWTVGFSTPIMEITGKSLALNDDAAFAGHEGENSGDGRVFIASDEVPFIPYGVGCAGSGGFIPQLSFTGCPSANQSVTMTVDQALAGASALVFIGFDQISAPIDDQGCNLLAGNLIPIVFVLPLFGSGPGGGSIQINFGVPTGPFVSLAMQAFVADPAGKKGYVATNGVVVNIE